MGNGNGKCNQKWKTSHGSRKWEKRKQEERINNNSFLLFVCWCKRVTKFYVKFYENSMMF